MPHSLFNRPSLAAAAALVLAIALQGATAARAEYIDLPAPPIPLGPKSQAAEEASKEAGAAQDRQGEMTPDTETVTGAVMNEKDMLQYCVNISDKAKEARYARIRAELEAAGKTVDEKLEKLEAKLLEVRDYVDRREKFLENARGALINIFGTMRADAAAAQLSELDTVSASAILMKLPPDRASTIMNEMSPKQAAEIAKMLIAASNGPQQKDATQ